MNSSSPAPHEPATSLDPLIDDVRMRFVSDFPMRCDAASSLVEGTVDPGTRAQAAQSLRALAHRLVGLAGIIGFHQVSAVAADLEVIAGDLEAGRADAAAGQAVVNSLRTAFAHELAGAAAARPAAFPDACRGDVLVAEDDDDQRAIVLKQLADAGYRAHGVASGHDVRASARAIAPFVILLDIEMPGLDGYAVCRELKADPELRKVPVVFMSSRARMDDRLAGLALGADDYLVKPVDPRELFVRLDRIRLRQAACAEDIGVGGILSYDEFLQVARGRASRSAVALVLMRVPAHQANSALMRVRDEIRRADLVSTYDRAHVVLLMPELTAGSAYARTNEIVNRLVELGLQDVAAGVACAPGAGTSVESLLADADHALMQARYCRKMVVLHGEAVQQPAVRAGASILVADDDPDVMRIVDAGLRGAGHQTSLAFDGAEALASLERHRPDVLILDLMMPKVGGFDLLNRLHQSDGPRPKIVVLSARGREEDVTRAFDLGADDYVTKPFNPQELLARVARLLR